MTFLRETKSWLYLLAILGTLILATAVLARCTQSQRQQARTEKVAVKSLDKVATETPAIRKEQEEKQREVDNIKGSDTRLPDGYGAELERLRMRDKHNPR